MQGIALPARFACSPFASDPEPSLRAQSRFRLVVREGTAWVTTVAGDLDLFLARSLAIVTAEFLALRHGAVAGRMGALFNLTAHKTYLQIGRNNLKVGTKRCFL